ncbi:MAG: DUF3866 family protein [Actinobacteria bacterium]|nr:DUF3866 family protein [Actinomycetota bacterium]
MASVLGFAQHLGGHPIAIVRASEADARERHRGISHHSATTLALTGVAVDVPVPPELGAAAGERFVTHRVIEVVPPDVEPVLRQFGLTVTTMGRGPADDPLSFRTVAAAAVHAVHSIV